MYVSYIYLLDKFNKGNKNWQTRKANVVNSKHGGIEKLIS